MTDGRITKVDAGPGNPFTDGYICQKVKHHARRVYAPERVLTPLRAHRTQGCRRVPALRRGTRPSTSWSSACAPPRRAPGRSRWCRSSTTPPRRCSRTRRGSGLWKRFGASRVRHTVCAATHGAAYHVVFGSMFSADPVDVVHSQLIVVWGANPTVSNIHFPPLVTRAQREHGATVVVVDPRRTAMAGRADLHLAVRPGTDVVLAYAVADELERQGLLADRVPRRARDRRGGVPRRGAGLSGGARRRDL